MRARAAAGFLAVLTLTTAGCQLKPPPLGSAPVAAPVLASAPDPTVDPGQWEFPTVCYSQWWGQGEVPMTVEGGSGRKVAVIGDSLTTQSRQILIGRGGFDWHVSSWCGARIVDYLPGGALTGAMDELQAYQPDLVVIALGTNDAHDGDDVRASAQALLDELPAGVHVAWVLPAASHKDDDFEIGVVRSEITNLPNITVTDWAALADTAGYRKDDGTHLTWDGATAYASLVAGGTRLLDESAPVAG
jgi:lysophospholipase L1-like esterase